MWILFFFVTFFFVLFALAVWLIILVAYEALNVYMLLFPIELSNFDLTSDGGTHGRDGPGDLFIFSNCRR